MEKKQQEMQKKMTEEMAKYGAGGVQLFGGAPVFSNLAPPTITMPAQTQVAQ